jgi:thiosulfate dehydrogenase [quinone] large subunit
MKDNKSYSTLQITALVILRFLIGWHLLYEGISKLLDPDWSSYGFLTESKWLLSGFANWAISHPGVLNAVDFLNTWGLIAIGLGLILGIFIRFAAVAGTVLLLLYFMSNPPLIGLEYSIPAEGNNLIVNKTLIEAAALFLLAVFPVHLVFGIESMITNYRTRKK